MKYAENKCFFSFLLMDSRLVCFCYFLESVHTVKDSNKERMSKKSVDEFLKCQ